MSTQPHSYVCTNPACTELNVKKDALHPIVGDVVCGKCGRSCTDAGPVTAETS